MRTYILNRSDWELKRIKYLATYNDEALPDNTEPDFEINYIEISDVDQVNGITNSQSLEFEKAPSRARRIVRTGDTLVSTVRTYLKAIAYVGNQYNNYIASTGFAVIRSINPDKIHPKYLGYCFQDKRLLGDIVSNSIGVSYPAINASALVRLTVYQPPYSEQTLIARFLDQKTSQIDKLIEQKEKLLKLLAEKRTAIITQAVTKGLDPTVEMKDSGIDWLGKIPKDWGTKRFKFCLIGAMKYGANEAAESSDPDQPRFVRITDVDENGNLRDETFRSIDEEIAKPFLLEEGDLLMARSGATVGKNFMYKSDWGVACFAGYLIRARLNQEIILPEFGNLFLSSGAYWDWVNSIFIQSTIQNISAEKYANFVLAIPPKEEQHKIVAYAMNKREQLGNIIEGINTSLIKLKEYREALITAAVTGQMDVRKEVSNG